MKDYLLLIVTLIIALLLFLLDFNYWIIGLVLITLMLIIVYRRHNLLGIFLIIIAFGLFPAEHIWLLLGSFMLGLIILLYSPIDETIKNAWEDMKKAEGSHPKEKFEEYAKGMSKHASEALVPTPNTGYNPRVFVEKSDKIAKNFFTELKELFK